jgi:hypothetical protein
MRRNTVAMVAVLAAAGLVSSGRAQNADQTVALEIAGGRATATMTVPAQSRPPMVCLVSATDADALAAALAAAGIATLRVGGNEEAVAQWITWLRNDARFPTVTVFGEGGSLEVAMIAARAARADGVVTRGNTSAAAAEIARLVAKIGSTSAGSVSGDAAAIAAFARTAPALGRRGTSAGRPPSERRSPRRTILTTVGDVRIGIEWGQPQKRGREIWGTLVRWDEEWMPGADEATIITTNGPIQIGSIAVPAGDHSIYALPGPERFQLIISKDVGQFHTVHETGLHLGRTELTLRPRTDSVEGLTFAIEPQTSTAAFKLIWDTREYVAPVSTR